jgi:hypothetical protein
MDRIYGGKGVLLRWYSASHCARSRSCPWPAVAGRMVHAANDSASGERKHTAVTGRRTREYHNANTSRSATGILPLPARKAFEIMIVERFDYLKGFSVGRESRRTARRCSKSNKPSTSQFSTRCFPTKTGYGRWPDSVKNFHTDLGYGHSHALWGRPCLEGQSASLPSSGLHPLADRPGACPLRVVSSSPAGIPARTNGVARPTPSRSLPRRRASQAPRSRQRLRNSSGTIRKCVSREKLCRFARPVGSGVRVL